MKKTVDIIGAGIGGLTLALTLKQNGLNANLYEGAPELRPVGAGIIIANNAMQVFSRLGIQDKIEKAGNKISSIKITDAQLKALSVVDLSPFEKKYGVHNIAIHRADLQKILAEEVGYENIHLSKQLAKIERKENFNLTFEDNSTIESKLLIGADGLKSVVRNQLFGTSTIRNTGQFCWRGICDVNLGAQYDHAFNEAWGHGKRFGFGKINDKNFYWFALTDSKKIVPGEVNLMDLFKEFHPDILKVIKATAKEQIIAGEILDLKPIYKWQMENVCLIGDAAHATTPNLGQGACQAIEDAFAIGQLLEKGMAIENTFEVYEKRRMKKAHNIVNTSWTMGKIAHWTNPMLVWLRNTALKLSPASANAKQLDAIFNINQ